MKNTFAFILAAAAGILAASCAKENVSADGTTQNLVPLSFKAVYDDNVKTYLDPIDEEKAHIAFTVGEEISIFYKTTGGAVEKAANNAVCSAYDATTGVATFSALVPEDADLTQEIIAIAGDAKCKAIDGEKTILDYTNGASQCLHTTAAKTQTAVKNGYDPTNFTSFGISEPTEGDRIVHFKTVPGLISYELENNSGKAIKAAYVYAATGNDPLIYKDDPELINRYSALAAEYFFYINDGVPVQGGSHQGPASYIMMGGFDVAGSEAATYYAVARPDTYSGIKVAFVNEDNKILIADKTNGLPEEMLVKRNTATNLPKFTINNPDAWQEITIGTECASTVINEKGGNFKFKVTGNCPWKITLKIDEKSNNTVLYPQDGIGECEVTLKAPALGEGKSSSSYVLTIEEQLPTGTGLTKKKCTLTLSQQESKRTIGSALMESLLGEDESKTITTDGLTKDDITLKSQKNTCTIGSINITEDKTTPEGTEIKAGTYYYFAGQYSVTFTETVTGLYRLSYTADVNPSSTNGTPPVINVTINKVITTPNINYINYKGETKCCVPSSSDGNTKVKGCNYFITEEIAVTGTATIQIQSKTSAADNKIFIDDKCPIIWERVGDLPTE